jgi:diacylglycerol kinase (ATP)
LKPSPQQAVAGWQGAGRKDWGTAVGRGQAETEGETVTPPRERRGHALGHWVGVAANSGSGRGAGRKAVTRLAESLAGLGVGCRIGWSVAEREAIVADASRDDACRCLVAAGGDGTVAALINELPSVPVAVLPTGTENLFARHFGFDRRPERLARSIVAGRTTRLDLGTAADRRFSLMAGFGFDADVVTRHHTARLSGNGHARPTHRGAYVEPVLQSSFRYRFPEIAVTIDDPGNEETIVGTSAFLFNLPRYALGLPFAPGAIGDDGRLDLVVFRKPGPFRALHYLWLVLHGLHLRRDDVHHRRFRSATVTSDQPVPFQLDGDPGGILVPPGSGSLSIGILPSAVEVIVP